MSKHRPINLLTPGVGLTGPGGEPLVSRYPPSQVPELELRRCERLDPRCPSCGARLFVDIHDYKRHLACAECNHEQEIPS